MAAFDGDRSRPFLDDQIHNCQGMQCVSNEDPDTREPARWVIWTIASEAMASATAHRPGVTTHEAPFLAHAFFHLHMHETQGFAIVACLDNRSYAHSRPFKYLVLFRLRPGS